MIKTLKDFVKREPAVAGHVAYLLAATVTLGGAWYLQIFQGLYPCPLCLDQREPWYAGATISVIVLVLPWVYVGTAHWRARGMIPNLGLILWGMYKAIEHIGVEHQWWGSACTTSGDGQGAQTIEDLLAGAATDNAVPCDAIQWEFLGLTLAGYNLLLQAGLFLLFGWLFIKAWKAHRR